MESLEPSRSFSVSVGLAPLTFTSINCILTGIFEFNADREPTRFHRIARPTVPELEALIQNIAHRVAKYLERHP